MQEYNTVDKKKIVDSYTDTEIRTLRALVLFESSVNERDNYRELTLAMQELNVLAKSLNSMIIGTFVNGRMIEPNLYVDDVLEIMMQQKLKEMLALLFEILSNINEIITDGIKKEKKKSLEQAIGKLSLMLRFDTLSLPEDIMQGVANMGNVYAQLSHLGELNSDHFMVRHMWQSSARKFLPEYDFDDTSIVMQGPIKYEGNFTIETLMRYRRIYPRIPIIVSTWEGEVTEEFKLISNSIGIDIVENVKPSDGGPWNIKYQLKSSIGGIQQAEEKKSKYVMKTRTDQAFLNPDFIVYMKNLLKTYPVNCESLTERIVFLGGLSSMCTCPFRITDFMSFGALGDIKKLYSASGDSERLRYTYYDADIRRKRYLDVLGRTPYDNYSSMCQMGEKERKEIVSRMGQKQDPESYLIQSFYERVILKNELSESDDVLKHYWRFIKHCTVLIDADELLFFWSKYTEQYMNISSNISDGGLTRAVWMSILYSDL